MSSKIEVLNSGFVQLIDHMGTDESISQAARVSYAKGTRKVSEDRDLIRFLMRHEHYSPFACCQVKLHLRVPLFVIGQMHRHDRFHWSMMSARYSVMPDEKWEPVSHSDLRGQGVGNKQVGNGQLDEMYALVAYDSLRAANQASQAAYQDLLATGVCREQARTVLPVGQYTEGFVTANLGDWMLFLKQRLSDHSQLEIQVYAQAIEQILNELFPICMEAFRDYQLNRVIFSAQEMDLILRLAKGKYLFEPYSFNEIVTGYPQMTLSVEANKAGLAEQESEHKKRIDSFVAKFLPNKREREEFLKKIQYV